MSTLPRARDEQACEAVLAQVARDVRSPGLSVVRELHGRSLALLSGLELVVRRQDAEEDIRGRLSASLRPDGCGGERWSIGVHAYVDECDEGCVHGSTVASAIHWLADRYDDISDDVAERLVAEQVGRRVLAGDLEESLLPAGGRARFYDGWGA